MIRFWGAVGCAIGLILLGWLARPGTASAQRGEALPQPEPPAVTKVLDSGVLIVISKASQRMYVFRDGAPWRSAPVSTGRRGHVTPSGTFAILQKAVNHRSNIYSNAPMPYMQRLTWGGIAIHAGYLPGYPASHGCIRVPKSFARALYGLTKASTTTVVITGERLSSHAAARQLALALPDARTSVPDTPPAPRLALALPDTDLRVPAAPPAPASSTNARRWIPIDQLPLYVPPRRNPAETIQFAAAQSPADAEARWEMLVGSHPELTGYAKTITSAVVGSRQYYRLRASAPHAHALCDAIRAAGQDCFYVG